MRQPTGDRVLSVVGPLGERLTKDQLPPARGVRWVARRKAEVVAAVNGGLLSVSAACTRYNLSLEELASWQRNYGQEGLSGLREAEIKAHRSRTRT